MGDPQGNIPYGNFVGSAYIVDVQVLAFVQKEHETSDTILDIDKRTRLFSCPLDRESNLSTALRRHQTSKASNKLRNNVFPSHIGSINVVRAEDEDALKVLSAIVDRH